jgi:hypothetical protein
MTNNSFHFLRPRPVAALLLFVMLGLAVGIFVVDTITDLEIAIAVFYVVVVLMSVFAFDRSGVLIVSAGCLALTIVSHFLTRIGSPETGPVNGLISLSAIVATTYLSLRIKSAEAAALDARADLVVGPNNFRGRPDNLLDIAAGPIAGSIFYCR